MHGPYAKDDEVTVDEIRNEIEVMKKLEHPNIVYIKEYFVQSGKFYIVMSWLKGGELLDALLDLGNYTASCVDASLRVDTYEMVFGSPRAFVRVSGARQERWFCVDWARRTVSMPHGPQREPYLAYGHSWNNGVRIPNALKVDEGWVVTWKQREVTFTNGDLTVTVTEP